MIVVIKPADFCDLSHVKPFKAENIRSTPRFYFERANEAYFDDLEKVDGRNKLYGEMEKIKG